MPAAIVNVGAMIDGSSGNQTIPYPASIANGHLLVIFAGFRNTAAGVIPAPSSTLTWTEIASLDTGYQKAWSAVYDGSATAPTITPAGNYMGGIMVAISGQAGSPSLDTAAANFWVQTNLRYPALTIANDNEIILTWCTSVGNSTSVAPTAGFTEIEDEAMWPVSGGHSQIQYQVQTSKSNITQADPVVTGGSSGTIRGFTIAIKAAAGSSKALLTMESNQGGF
jgi:hypothetical protein